MKSAGTLERSHCCVTDAVGALLLVLQNGGCGKAYNIADKRLQMTVRAFAEQAAQARQCRVIQVKPSEAETRGYAKTRRAVLDAEKLEKLGWRARYDIVSGIQETINILKEVGM